MTTNQLQVPKIIHQIWIGVRPVPTKWTQTWVQFCAEYGFTYKLWREADIDALLKFHPCKDKYDALQAYNAKSDIARLEILTVHGGIYIDADTVFLSQNVEQLMNWKNLVLVPEPDPAKKILGTAIIGCIQGHPFLKFLSANISTVIENRQRLYGYDSNASWITTGPAYFTEAFTLMKPEASILDPMFFYPTGWEVDHTEKTLPRIRNEYPKATTFHYGYETCKMGDRYPQDHFVL